MNSTLGTTQLTLDFTPGLTQQFPLWEDVLAAAVYASRKGLNGVAGDLDMSPSELCRRLNRNGDDHRPLRVGDADKIIASTGDHRPVYWLIERHLGDPRAKQQQALAQIPALVAQLNALMEAAGPAVRAVK